METLEQLLDFGRGTLTQPARVRVTMGHHVLHAEVVATGGTVQIMGIAKANRPNIAELLEPELNKLLREGHQEGRTFQVSFTKPLNHPLALVGWLRAAYLVAFALYGYRYIFDSRLELVRRQIAAPHVQHIPLFAMTLTDAQPADRHIVLIREPEQYRSLYIQMGRHAVFLPSPEDASALYPRLEATYSAGTEQHFTYHGDIYPWPTEPIHLFDLDGPPS
ncbi:MAG TPA: hypothetical protein VFW96_19605 [Thermomicrobiales bacterium]|nr:hypothetical protein [Thermomicrobiales bacterium]